MKTGDRIKLLRDKIGISQSELAKLCGWDTASSSGGNRIGNYEKNIRNPKREDLIKISKAFTSKFLYFIDPAWLQFGTGEPPPFILFENATIPRGSIPILSPNDIKVNLNWRSLDKKDFNIIPLYGSDNEKCYALRVKGDSMISSIPGKRSFLENDIIIIDPDKTPSNGDFVIALKENYNDRETLFSQYILYAGKNYLKPLNPQYPTITIDKTITTVGVVIAHIDILPNT